MAPVVIFGVGSTADLAHYYLTHDSTHSVTAFTCEQRHISQSTKFGLPVVPYEDLQSAFPPTSVHLFAPCTGNNLNKFRERVYLEGKRRGYRFISYISSHATVLTNMIGENCFILEDNTIQPFAKIGNNCVLWSGNHIGHHSTIEDHVFITSHVVVAGNCLVKKYSWLGINAAISDRVTVAQGTVVGMCAGVTKDTTGNAVYVGVPAKKLRDCDDSIIL
jgi:sugar O-acyltransferase (sialic acid O-acetyltransferase NeuD family)